MNENENEKDRRSWNDLQNDCRYKKKKTRKQKIIMCKLKNHWNRIRSIFHETRN